MSTRLATAISSFNDVGSSTIGVTELSCLLCLFLTLLLLIQFRYRYEMRVRIIMLTLLLVCLSFSAVHVEWTNLTLSGLVIVSPIKDSMVGFLFAAFFSVCTICMVHIHMDASRRSLERSIESAVAAKGLWNTLCFKQATLFAPKEWESAILRRLEKVVYLMIGLEVCMALLCCIG